MTHLLRTRTVLGTVVALAALSLSACGGEDDGGDGSPKESTSDSSAPDSSAPDSSGPDAAESDAPESDAPELEGIPDVVAEVNGEELTKEEFAPFYQARLQQASAAAQSGGEAPDEDAIRQQTADTLVDTVLLRQEAEARGIEVTDKEVDAELDRLAKDYQLDSGDALLAALEEQGTTAEQAREQVGKQLSLEKLVKDEDGTFEPTEKQLRELYAVARSAAEAQGQKAPSFAEARLQLEQRATTEWAARVAQDLVDELRADADITVNLD